MTTHRTGAQIIRAHNTKALENPASVKGNRWGERHWNAYTNFKRGAFNDVAGYSVVQMIEALAAYADSHYKRYETPIGQDYFLGVQWSNIAQATRALLNGECGALDCGTLDAIILDIMASNDVDPDTGDLGYKPTKVRVNDNG